jgi:hypothetical protein
VVVTRPNFGRLGQHYGEVYRPREGDEARRRRVHDELAWLVKPGWVRSLIRRRDDRTGTSARSGG